MPTTYPSQTQLDIRSIETSTNVRTHMDPDKLRELTLNVKKFGVLEPILVRPDGEGKFRLIAGHRRLEASKLARLSMIPARILETDAHKAEEIQVFENLHREDLSPLDEARAFRTLLATGQTHETLAAKVDKSVTYVYRSLRLLELPESGLQALATGKLTARHAHQILRAAAKHHEALITYATQPMPWEQRYPTVDELKNHINKTIARELGAACFPKDVAYAGEIACSGCPFNTGNQGALFDGASDGLCVSPTCFTKKTAFYYKELAAVGAKRFPGLGFLGAATASYHHASSYSQIKGALIVEKITAPLKEAMNKNPDAFGYGIVKPYGQDRGKPKLVLLCKEPKLLGLKSQAEEAKPELTPEERQRNEFVQESIEKAYYQFVFSKWDFDKADLLDILAKGWKQGWSRGTLYQLINAAWGLDIASDDLAKAPFPKAFLEKQAKDGLVLLVLVWWGGEHDLDIMAALKRRKLDVKVIVRQAEKDARATWDKAPAK